MPATTTDRFYAHRPQGFHERNDAGIHPKARTASIVEAELSVGAIRDVCGVATEHVYVLIREMIRNRYEAGFGTHRTPFYHQ